MIDIEKLKTGNPSGYKVKTIYGRNPDIDIADGFETIWNGGGLYTGFDATEAQTVLISSAITNDTSDGTGARTLRVWGLDANYAETTEKITLNGTTDVETTNSYLRLDRARVLTAGSSGNNIAEITGKQSTTTQNVFFVMPANFNKTAICAYTIPAGFKGYVRSFAADITSSLSAFSEVHLLKRPADEVFSVHEVLSATAYYNNREFPEIDEEVLQPKTDIKLDADTNTDNTTLSGNIDILLQKI